MDDVVKIPGVPINVEPCPEDCDFNWVKFFKDFELALAHYIQDSAIPPAESSVTLLAKYFELKKHLKIEKLKKEK